MVRVGLGLWLGIRLGFLVMVRYKVLVKGYG